MAGAHNSSTSFKSGTKVTPKHFRPVIVMSSIDGFNRSLTAKRRKRQDRRRTPQQQAPSMGPITQDDEQRECLLVRCLLSNEPRQLRLMNIIDAITDGVDETMAKGEDSLYGRWEATRQSTRKKRANPKYA